MICIQVNIKFTKAPLKRTPVELVLDKSNQRIGPVATDREGKACFDEAPTSGIVIIDGVERYQGHLDYVKIELRNLTEMGSSFTGAASDTTSGNTAYPNMTIREIVVQGQKIQTDSEGYLVDPADWSEAFARQLAEQENLELKQEHWQVIRFQRDWYSERGTQASVREIIKYFRSLWGCDRGCNHYLHKLFPRGGPQKQGNRLASLLRTKGEH